MTALNDAERVAAAARTAPPERAFPVPPEQTSRFYPTWLPSRRFISAVIAIGGMQLLATMDSTVAIVALPKIQDELALVRCRPQLGDHGVCADLRRPDAAGRTARRHHRAQAHLHRRRRAVHHRVGAVRGGLGRGDTGHRPAAAGCRRGDRQPDGSGAGGDHVPQGPRTQRRHRGVRRDDGHRLGDGPGCRRRAHRGVVAAGVPGQRAARPGDDLPGPHHAARDAQGADEARRGRRAAGDAGLYGGGVRVLAGPRERLADARSVSARRWWRWSPSSRS